MGLVGVGCSSMGLGYSFWHPWLCPCYPVCSIFSFSAGDLVVATVIARATVNDAASPEHATKLLGSLGMGMSLAPSPIFGGYIGEMAGWRASFWVFAVTGLGLWLLSWSVIPKTRSARYENAGKIMQEYGTLMINKQFWGYALVMIGAIGGFFVFISCLPLVASTELNLSQSQTGIGIGSITVGFFVGNFISSRLTGQYGLNRMITLGRVIACLGIFISLGLLFFGWVKPWGIFFGVVMMGLGNGITLPSANVAVMSVIRCWLPAHRVFQRIGDAFCGVFYRGCWRNYSIPSPRSGISGHIRGDNLCHFLWQSAFMERRLYQYDGIITPAKPARIYRYFTFFTAFAALLPPFATHRHRQKRGIAWQ